MSILYHFRDIITYLPNICRSRHSNHTHARRRCRPKANISYDLPVLEICSL